MDFYIATEPFKSITLLRRKTIWYSIRDSNWSDPNTWMSNRLDKGLITYPQTGDDVVINHAVTVDNGAPVNITINNLTVNPLGSLIIGYSGPNITINGNLQSTGLLNFNSKTFNLNLYGTANSFSNAINTNGSIVSYFSIYAQDIQPITYYELDLRNGIRNAISNLVLNNTFRIQDGTTFNQYGYNLTVGSQTQFSSDSGGVSTWNMTGGNTNVFIGQANLGAQYLKQYLNLNGTGITMEFRGGLGLTAVLTEGTVAWNFTTNSQTWRTAAAPALTIQGNVTVFGNITLTMDDPSWAQSPLTLNGVVNGTTSGSTLILNGGAVVWFASTSTIMSTGVFNPSSWDVHTAIGFVQTGNYTIPYTNFSGTVHIGGSGTKTLSGNTTIGGNTYPNQFTIYAGTFECGGFTLSMACSSTFNTGTLFSQNGSGAIVFGGQLVMPYRDTMSLTGNPNVEFRGGVKFPQVLTALSSYTGTFSFTTNNQTIDITGAGSNVFAATAIPILIVGTIQVTFIDPSSSTSPATVSGVINGTVAGSTLIMGANIVFNYTNATAPMATGQLWANQAANTFIYGASGNQDITPPSDATNPGYYNLTLNGSGAKRLLGNVSVKHTYVLGGSATLNSNGFALTNP